MKQDESGLRLPLQQGTHSQSIGGAPGEADGEAGERWSEETTGEVVSCGLELRGTSCPGHRG